MQLLHSQSVPLILHRLKTGFLIMRLILLYFWLCLHVFVFIALLISQPFDMSHVMRKVDLSICENKGPDQLCSNCIADCTFVLVTWIVQFLRYLLSKLEASSVLCLSAKAGLCRTWLEPPKTSFLMSRLVLYTTYLNDIWILRIFHL